MSALRVRRWCYALLCAWGRLRVVQRWRGRGRSALLGPPGGTDGPGGTAGVREPRRPPPSSPPTAQATLPTVPGG